MRIIYIFFATCATVLLAWINVGCYRAPQPGTSLEDEQLIHQLQFLEQRIHNGLGAEMQHLFPEGSVFTHALYALAWCGVAERHGVNADIKHHAIAEARWAYGMIDTPQVKDQFSATDGLSFGAFYCGWRNFVLVRLMEVSGPAMDTALTRALARQSEELAQAFGRSRSPFLASYPGMAWPADATVGMASLCAYDRSHGGMYEKVIADWVTEVRQRLDPSGLIPHAWHPLADSLAESARGCSQSLINAFLPSIDPALAAEQFAAYKEHFFTRRLGLSCVCEYQSGTAGMGDVDSGPVILGVGSSATIVGPAACRANNDGEAAWDMDATIEGLGFVTGGQHKQYIFGSLPIADLFIAWGRSFGIRTKSHTSPAVQWFNVWSLLIVLVVWIPMRPWRLWGRRSS